jgi:hypothetical protein
MTVSRRQSRALVEHGEAHAHRDGLRSAAARQAGIAADRGHQLVRDRGGLLAAPLGQQDRELVAADPGEDVRPPEP